MMRTAEKILHEWGCIYDNDDIDKKDAIAAMKEYAIELIDHILSDTSLIYVDGEYYGEEAPEALYDYEKWQQLKESLI